MEGGELEDQGDLGTSLTHWEKRVFGDEAMTGNHQELERDGRLYSEQKMISRMTLAVLHDSGWYNVDFSRADSSYSWGRHLGCDFVMKSCLEFIESHKNIKPYCVNPTSFTQRSQVFISYVEKNILTFPLPFYQREERLQEKGFTEVL